MKDSRRRSLLALRLNQKKNKEKSFWFFNLKTLSWLVGFTCSFAFYALSLSVCLSFFLSLSSHATAGDFFISSLFFVFFLGFYKTILERPMERKNLSWAAAIQQQQQQQQQQQHGRFVCVCVCRTLMKNNPLNTQQRSSP